uniref:hypothetical protein n=1 Tax=Nitzschia dubiiformis TaxID=515482 RepID=UPI0021150E26|nr:hypothetical protein NRL27_pgp136 [Nitzschia dubiiformis]UTQ75544.1 hypothetical protein [Nitzschia dubiiformis]
MLYFFRVLLLLINLDQETVLNWFRVESLTNQNIYFQQSKNDTINALTNNVEFTPTISLKTLRLILEGFWDKVQDGLTLADIENILFFILFIRFIILAIRYNLKTSFYITCIGLFAGYLWYRHLIDLISMYRSILIKLPYLQKLGIDAIQLRTMNRQIILTDLKLGDNVHWYNPGQLIYYAFARGITNVNPETGFRYYIDPISMIISNLKESDKVTILPTYYKIYNKIIPQIFESCGKFWGQLSGIAAYAIITRIGKRYCPYLIRWHWTFLLIIGFIEQILVYFVYRISYFQGAVLIPQTQISTNYLDQNLILQVNILNGLIAFIVSLHLGLIFFGLFHAIWGQYFYFPFLVENTELHIGPRPKTSIYSGGNTAWQDEKEKNIRRIFPKFWYGWFGNGSNLSWNFFRFFQTIIKKFLK